MLQGERIGTVFHQDAHLWTLVKEECARDLAVAARECSRKLRVLNSIIFFFFLIVKLDIVMVSPEDSFFTPGELLASEFLAYFISWIQSKEFIE